MGSIHWPPAAFHAGQARCLALLLAMIISSLAVIQPASVRAAASLFELRWSSSEADLVQVVAWADYDRDGDPDLAVGTNGQPLRVYRNDNGQLSSSPIWWLYSASNVTSVVWRDLNGDGTLDLIAAGSDPVFQIYVQQGGGHFFLVNTVNSYGNTRSLAVADVNGDSTLDIILGNQNQPSQVYLNNGGNFSAPLDLPGSGALTTGVVVGDLDGNNQPDIILGNQNQPSQVYLNNGGGNFSAPLDLPGSGRQTFGVALGDLDGDGDRDIVLANSGMPSQVFRNNSAPGSFPPLTPLDLAGSGRSTTSVALGDLNGDRAQDIVLTNYGQLSQFYLNNGPGQFAAPADVPLSGGPSTSAALADSDGDGDLDLAVGNYGQPTQLYRNTSAESSTRVRVTKAGQAVAGALVYRRESNQAGLFQPFSDSAGNPLYTDTSGYLDQQGQIVVGQQLVAALPVITSTVQLSADPPQAMTKVLTTITSTLTIERGDLIRDLNVINLTGIFRDTKIILQSPSGTQVKIIENLCAAPTTLTLNLDDEAAGGWICAAGNGSFQPINPLAAFDGENSAGTWRLIVTKAAGYPGALNGWGLAIKTSAYALYYTSAAPTATGLDGLTVTQAMLEYPITLDVSDKQPLALFDLDVSLEWDVRSDTQYLTQLKYDLQRTSEFLYDWTNGQAALGEVRIYDDGRHWETAHIRIAATNRLRPNASQGGIVSQPVTETIQLADGMHTSIYEPGQVRIGAVWNRFGDSVGTVGEDWPRTLAHELGHYLFYLDDNYLGLDHGQIVTVSGCPGAMSDPYRDEQSEFQADIGWMPACAQTLSNQNTGRSDWSTIASFYPLIKPTTREAINPGPSNLPLPVTKIIPVIPASPPDDALAVPIFNLIDANTKGRVLPSTRARAFLFRGDRLFDLGRPTLDQVEAQGARVNDRLCVYEQAAQRLGCKNIDKGASQLELSTIATWNPEVMITPMTTRTLEIVIPAGGVGDPAVTQLEAQLFPIEPAALIGAPALTATLKLVGQQYAGTIVLPAPVTAGLVRVIVNEPDPRREVVTDYALGGDPAPPRRPRAKSRRRAPAISADGQVILFSDNLTFAPGEFISLQTATALAAAPPWTSVVGQGYRLINSPGAPALKDVTLNMSYLEDDLPAGTEAGIGIYFFPKDGSAWQRLSDNARLDTDHNEASATAQGAGLYALMTSVDVQLGWNLFSYPWQATLPVTNALALMHADGYTTIYGYDTSDLVDPWKLYDRTVPPWVNDLEYLRYGRGYWIYIDRETTHAPASVVQARAQDSSSIPNPPATYYGVLSPGVNYTPKPGQQIRALVGETECGDGQTRQVGSQVVFVVDVRADDGQKLAGCGVPGRQVTFMIDDYIVPFAPRWDNSRPHGYGVERLYLPIVLGS